MIYRSSANDLPDLSCDLGHSFLLISGTGHRTFSQCSSTATQRVVLLVLSSIDVWWAVAGTHFAVEASLPFKRAPPPARAHGRRPAWGARRPSAPRGLGSRATVPTQLGRAAATRSAGRPAPLCTPALCPARPGARTLSFCAWCYLRRDL